MLAYAGAGRETKAKEFLASLEAFAHASDGATALDVAAERGQAQLVQMLLASQADVHVPAHDGSTALSVARTNRVTQLLKAAGAK